MTVRQETRAWSLLGVGALAIAGVFALLLVFSRTPVIQDFLPWPWKSFFHKGLVTHVVFSFVVWFLASMGTVMSMVFARKMAEGVSSAFTLPAISLAVIGCLGLIVPALFDLGTAELNNYVPVMNHPVYYIGLSCLMSGLVLVCLRQLTLKAEGDVSVLGTQACALIYLIAVVCMLLAALLLPHDLAEPSYNEHLFWGGGHVLQFVNTALLGLVWVSVVKTCGKTNLLALPYGMAVFGLLLAFVLPTPILYAFMDVMGQPLRDFYTELLRFGLPLSSTVLSLSMLTFLLSKAGRGLDGTTKAALWLSLFTYNLGGVYGLMLDGTDTRVPAHYHAVIGGINLALMIFYHRVVLPFIRSDVREGRLFTAQYWLYGLGQIMHASGMFLAGSQGVPRKTAGAAQSLDNLDKVLSMGLMGAGGLIAVIGGVLFVIMTLRWMLQSGGSYEKV